MIEVLKLALAFLRERTVRTVVCMMATAAATCLVIWVTSGYDALAKTYDEFANRALGRFELAIAPIGTADDLVVPDDVAKELREDPRIRQAEPMWMFTANIDHEQRQRDKQSEEQNGDERSRSAVAKADESSSAQPRDRAATNSPPAGGSPFGRGPGGGPGALLPSLVLIASNAETPPFKKVEGQWLNVATLGSAMSAVRSDVKSELDKDALNKANDTSSESSADDVTLGEIVVRSDIAEKRRWSLGDVIELSESETSGSQVKTAARLKIVGIIHAPTLPDAGYNALKVLAPSSGEAFVTTAVAEKMVGRKAQATFVGISMAPEADINAFRFNWAPRLNNYDTPVQFQESIVIEEALDQAEAARNVRLQSYASTAIAMVVAWLVIFCTLSMGVAERSRQYAILRAIGFRRVQVGGLILVESLAMGLGGFVWGTIFGWIMLQVVETSFARILYHGADLGPRSLIFAAIASAGGAFFAFIVPAHRAMSVRPVDAMSRRPAEPQELRRQPLIVLVGLLLLGGSIAMTWVVPQLEESLVVLALVLGFFAILAGFLIVSPLGVVVVDSLLSPLLAVLLKIDRKLLSSQITEHRWRTIGAAVAMAFGLGLFIAIQVWGFTMLKAFVPGRWVPDSMIVFDPDLAPEDVEKIKGFPEIDQTRRMDLVVEQPRLKDDVTDSASRASVTRQDNVVIVGLDPALAFGGERPMLEVNWIAGDGKGAVEGMKNVRGVVVPDHFLNESGLELGDSIELVPPESPGKVATYTIVGAGRFTGWHWQTKLTDMRTRTHRAAAIVFADYSHVASDFSFEQPTHLWFSFADDQVDIDGLSDKVTAVAKESDDLRKLAGVQVEENETRMIAVQSIRDHLQGVARRWIWLVSQLPLMVLLIGGLGTFNVLSASIRNRRWEFGVLRSIGTTRLELFRTILAEALMIALVAVIMGCSFGIMAGWYGCELSQRFSFFGGLRPTLEIPWLPMSLGSLAVVLLATVGSLWPAFATCRSATLEMLHECHKS